MLKTLILRCSTVLISTTLLLATRAYAYIDPGTTSAVFSSLAYVLAAIATALGFLFWPIKRFYHYIKDKRNTGEK